MRSLILILIFLTIGAAHFSPRQKENAGINKVMKKSASPSAPAIPTRTLAVLKLDPNRIVTNKLSLNWDASPSLDVMDYNLYIGTNEAAYYTSFPVGTVTNLSLVFTNALKSRPARWFFGLTAVNSSSEESDKSIAHWPIYPPTLTGLRLGWGETNQVSVESSPDLYRWNIQTNLLSDHLDIPIQSNKFFRTNAKRALSLTINPIYTKDPREP